ncbi:type II secretion system protein [Candidatus Berkelbacteria bacterium]|nr:type II secretion system protein [Candidatus Berkelbacteria bacterium]
MLKIRKGFTLVELLVVIAIIGVIAALVIVNLSSARGKGRDARRKQDLDTIRLAIEGYMDQNNITTPPGTAGANYYSDNVTDWPALANAIGTTIVSTLPKDPTNTGGYRYHYVKSTTSDDYEINVQLEKDTNAMTNDGGNNISRYEIGSLLTIIP